MFERINKKVKGFTAYENARPDVACRHHRSNGTERSRRLLAGTTALTTVTEEIAGHVPIVVKLCYAIAGVVTIVGAISVYEHRHEQRGTGREKKIMMVVGACIFLIAAARHRLCSSALEVKQREIVSM